MSKAWVATEGYEGLYMAVFADTRSRARKHIWDNNDDIGFFRFIDINPKREKPLDYLNKPDGYVMNWNKAEDRIALVRDCGWTCLEVDHAECADCPAKEWCDEYAYWLNENEIKE